MFTNNKSNINFFVNKILNEFTKNKSNINNVNLYCNFSETKVNLNNDEYIAFKSGQTYLIKYFKIFLEKNLNSYKYANIIDNDSEFILELNNDPKTETIEIIFMKNFKTSFHNLFTKNKYFNKKYCNYLKKNLYIQQILI